MSWFFPRLPRLLLWSAALFFGFVFWLGPIAASGAVLGASLALFLEGKRLPIGWGRTLPAAVVAAAVALALALVFQFLAGWIAPAVVSVVSFNLCCAIFAGISVVWISSLIAIWSGFDFVEAIAAALVASIPFLESKGGHFLRPRWFSDLVLSAGGDPAMVLSYTGAGMILVLLTGFLLLPRNGKEEGSTQMVTGGLFAMLLITSLAAFLLPKVVPPVPSAPLVLPKPPMSFSGNPPPPPPPQPEPVAAVQLSDILNPSHRLHGFYFRKPDPETLTDSMPWTNRLARYTVWYLKPGVGPLVLPGKSLEMPVVSSFDRAKSASWSATCLEAISNHEDFIIHPDDDPDTILSSTGEVGVRSNTPAVPSPEEARFLASLDSVMARKAPPPEKGVIRTLIDGGNATNPVSGGMLSAVMITEWIASHGCLDDSSTNAPKSADDFIRAGMKGREVDFTLLAVDLLKARGLEARKAEGYFVPADQQPDDRLIITDAEAATWPEVRALDGEWIPLPVRPWKTDSHDQSKPPEDRKKEIFDALAKDRHPPKSSQSPSERRTASPRFSTGWGIILAPLAVILGVFLVSRILVPIRTLIVAPADLRPRILLGMMGSLSTVRDPRRFGQSWERYAEEVLGNRNLHRGRLMRAVVPKCSLDKPSPMGAFAAVFILLSFRGWGFVPNFLQFTLHPTNPSPPPIIP
jgi:hypothetical protein